MRVILLVCLFIILAAFTQNPSPYIFPELKFFPNMPNSVSNPVTNEGVTLGRYLFYDPTLSLNFDLSCASCHKQEKAFSDAPNTFTKGHKGMLSNRNTMPLFNLAWYSSFFWDGRASSLEEQIFHPVRDATEMSLPWKIAVDRVQSNAFYTRKFKAAFGNQKIDSILIAKAIGQFLRTLISNQSKFDKVIAGEEYLTKEEYAGFVLMNDMTRGDCLHCHTTDANALGTTGGFSNNGLDDIKDPGLYKDKGLGGYTNLLKDNGKFKIPSLRNIAVTAPYMHDGRFETLEEVLDFYSEGVQHSANLDSKMGLAHQRTSPLTALEKKQIIAFLKTLTDSNLLSNPVFGNPFINMH